jgi:hypothetical protein
MTVVTLECAGVLTGEKSAEIVAHVEQIWAQGQHAVELLRRELPEELVDTLAPRRAGGVHLQKIFGVMHDTCHAANKVASLMVELRTAKAREFHGEEQWASPKPVMRGHITHTVSRVGICACLQGPNAITYIHHKSI